MSADFGSLIKTLNPEKHIITENLKIVDKFSLAGAFFWANPPSVTRVIERLTAQLPTSLPMVAREKGIEECKALLKQYVQVNAPRDRSAKHALEQAFSKMDSIWKRSTVIEEMTPELLGIRADLQEMWRDQVQEIRLDSVGDSYSSEEE